MSGSEDGKIVLIDDDRLFGYALMEMAREEGIDLDYYESLSDLGFVGNLGRYRAAVVDYHLELMTGVEIARYLESLFGGIPMLLISSDAAAGAQNLPACVYRFVNKSSGLETIVQNIRGLLATAANSVQRPSHKLRGRPVLPLARDLRMARPHADSVLSGAT